MSDVQLRYICCMLFVLFLAWMGFRAILISGRNTFFYLLAHYYFETMNCILIAQLPGEALLFRGKSYREQFMTQISYISVWHMAHPHIAFSVSAKNILSFHLPVTKCPMKFQNEMANTECTPEFSKIIWSHSYLMQQIFLQVTYYLWSSVYK